jgi:hypothetical protein
VFVRSENGLERRRTIDAHEGAVAGAEEKAGLDESRQHGRAILSVERPQPARLIFSEPQTGHLEKFSLDAQQCFFRGPI